MKRWGVYKNRTVAAPHNRRPARLEPAGSDDIAEEMVWGILCVAAHIPEFYGCGLGLLGRNDFLALKLDNSE